MHVFDKIYIKMYPFETKLFLLMTVMSRII
jgi:hypothetical protein